MARVDEELTELATAAANSMVAAMGTELWPSVSGLIRRLLIRRPRQRAELTVALDQLSAEGAVAVENDGGGALSPADRAETVRFWADALEQLVRQDAALRPALAALAGLTLPIPAPGAPRQQNSAHGFGRVYANQFGAQIIDETEQQGPK